VKVDRLDHEHLANEAVQALTPLLIEDRPMSAAERLAIVKAYLSAQKLPKSTAHNRRPGMFYPGLRTAPIHDPSDFAWVDSVLDRTSDFVSELSALERQGRQSSGFHTVWPEYTQNGEWAAFWLRLYGRTYTANAARCPKTLSVIESVPRQAGWLGFSAMAPGTHVAPHCGFTNAKLRCHVPLELSPSGNRIRIGDTLYSWKVGEILIFDDSFEHEVWNDSQARRVVLIFDIFHPDLSDDEVQFLSAFEHRTLEPVYAKLMQAYAALSSDVAWMKRPAP
jgi:aspartyl/asparaginyl beta-hydroxylase (cupin superfamily)